jgi:hypothetical protein
MGDASTIPLLAQPPHVDVIRAIDGANRNSNCHAISSAELPHVIIMRELDGEQLIVEIRRLRRDGRRLHSLTLAANRFATSAVTELRACFTNTASPTSSPAASSSSSSPSSSPSLACPLASLTALDMSCSVLDDVPGWSWLLLSMRSLHLLTTLDLSNTRVGRYPQHLCKLLLASVHLRQLRLDGCEDIDGPSNGGAAALATTLTYNRRLELLSLQGCPLTPSALAAVLLACSSVMTSLRTLVLAYVPVMTYRYGVSIEPSVDEVPLVELVPQHDRPYRTRAHLLDSFRRRMDEPLTLGPGEAADLQSVYDALRSFAGHTVKHRNLPSVSIDISGWSNPSGMMTATINSALSSPICRIAHIECVDSRMTTSDIDQLRAAIVLNHNETDTLRTMTLRLTDKQQYDAGALDAIAKMHRLPNFKLYT